jgi:hypothetical protein
MAVVRRAEACTSWAILVLALPTTDRGSPGPRTCGSLPLEVPAGGAQLAAA